MPNAKGNGVGHIKLFKFTFHAFCLDWITTHYFHGIVILKCKIQPIPCCKIGGIEYWSEYNDLTISGFNWIIIRMDTAKSSLHELGLTDEDILPVDFDNSSKIPFLVVYIIIIVLAMFGNVIVIVTICVTRRNRTLTYQLLISLSLSYILISVPTISLHLLEVLDSEWTHGSILCKFLGYSKSVQLVLDVSHWLAISIDRWVCSGPYEDFVARSRYLRQG